MKQWYLFYSEKLKWPISELQTPDIQFETKLKRAVSELESNVEGDTFPYLVLTDRMEPSCGNHQENKGCRRSYFLHSQND